MNPEEETIVLLQQLERIANKLCLKIRYENLNPDPDEGRIRGGMCRIRDRRYILIESRLTPVEKCQVFLDVFRNLDLSEIFIPPAVRRLIEQSAG